MAIWTFGLMVEIHNVLQQAGLTVDYRTDYAVFCRGPVANGKPGLKLYFGPNARHGVTPRVDVVNFSYPAAKAPRDPNFGQRYRNVSGELALDGSEAEVVDEVRRAAKALRLTP